MSVLTNVGSFNIDTAKTVGQTQAITGVGFTPKGVIFWWSGSTATTDGASASDIIVGFGAAQDVDNRIALWCGSNDDAATTATSRNYDFNACIGACLNGTTTVDGLMDFSSFDSDGFTLVVDNQFSVSIRVSYMAFGGDDFTEMDIGFGAFPNATGNFSITDCNFQPEALIFASVYQNTSTLTYSSTTNTLNLGAAVSSSKQGTVAEYDRGGQANSSTGGYCYNGECIGNVNTTNLLNRASFVSMDATGFTLNCLETNSSGRYFAWVAFLGGSWDVGSLNTRTDGNDIAVTGLGFQPEGLLFMSTNRALSTQDTYSANASMSIGAASSTTNRAAQGIWSENSLADAETSVANYDTACYVNIQNDAIVGLMDLKSVETDGFTCVMDDTDPSASWVLYLAVGTPATTSVNFRRSLTPRIGSRPTG